MSDGRGWRRGRSRWSDAEPTQEELESVLRAVALTRLAMTSAQVAYEEAVTAAVEAGATSALIARAAGVSTTAIHHTYHKVMKTTKKEA